MKGIIFTEFLEMVESQFGEEMVEMIIEDAQLASHGVYTSVGTYPSGEMVALLQQLAKRSQKPMEELMQAFGQFLYYSLKRGYPHFFGKSLFDFLSSVHTYIHVEVLKLYPDAELPDLEILSRDENTLVLLYSSPRKMGAVARGLLMASIQDFGVDAVLGQEVQDQHGSKVRFVISKSKA